MKKILLLFLSIFIISCSIFGAKLDISNFSTKNLFPKNNGINLKINSEMNEILSSTKENFENYKKNKIDLEEKPSISSQNFEYSGQEINTIVIKIYENILKNHPKNTIKTFYTNSENKELFAKDIFKLDSKHSKNILTDILKNKLKHIDGVFQDEEILNQEINSFIRNPKFYINEDIVVFLFESGIVTNIEKGIIEIKIDFRDLFDILNPEIFPEVKKEIERKIKELEEKKAKNQANKNFSLTEKEGIEKNSGKKYVALTFDDGPSNKTTPQLLDILKKYDIKATFFVLGKMANAYPEVLKREFEEGHEIASHSWDHPNLMSLSKEKISKQITSTDEKINEIIGKIPTLMRPPYGAHNKNIDNIIGKTIVLWNVDSMDWKHRNVEKNLKTTLSQITNGSIILFHDIHQPSVDTIEPLIKNLKEKGYEFLTVSELLDIGQNGDFAKKVCHGEFNCRDY